MHPALALIALSGTDSPWAPHGACPCTQNGARGQMSATPAPNAVPKTSLWVGGVLLAGVVGYIVWAAE